MFIICKHQQLYSTIFKGDVYIFLIAIASRKDNILLFVEIFQMKNYINQMKNNSILGSSWQQKKSFPYAAKHRPAPGIKGSLNCKYSLSVFTQFDPALEIIIGYVDKTASLNGDLLESHQIQEYEDGPLPLQFVNGGAKYLQNFVSILQDRGINVLRVGEDDFSQVFQVGGVKTFGFCCFSSRDIPFVYHDSFYEFPSVNICRSQQFKVFEWIQQQLHAKGSKIYSGWATPNKYNQFRTRVPELSQFFKSQDQVFGDAANLIKLGLDILFLVSQSASRGLWRLFQKVMHDRYGPKIRVHPILDVYRGYHIDTTFTVLGFNKKVNKNLVLAEGFRINPINMPAIFRGQNWAVIRFTDFKEQHKDSVYACSSPSSMNFLVINPHLVIISDKQTQLKRVLEFYDIEVITIQHKYARNLYGGLHCSSNDICREDVHGFSKIIERPSEELTLNERAGLFDPKLLQKLEQANEDLKEWPLVCNQNGIFPNYLSDHLSEELKDQQNNLHERFISEYKAKSQK